MSLHRRPQPPFREPNIYKGPKGDDGDPGPPGEAELYVAVDGAAAEGPRDTVNIITGQAVGATAVDNPGDSRIDVTLSVDSATTSAVGVVELATDGEALAGKVVQGNDSRLSDDRNPLPHATDHENGGGDVINVTGLSGKLADPQDPDTHAASHQDGGTDEINVGGLSGKLADPQDPDVHGSTHASNGSDPIPAATEAVRGTVELATSAETTAGLAVQASDTRLSDARTPLAHAESHASGFPDSFAAYTLAMTAALVAGAAISNGAADADDLIVGDGVGSRGQTIYSGNASTGALYFADVSAGSQGGVLYNHSGDLMTLRIANAAQYSLSSSALYPVTSAARDLGIASTNLWRDGHFSRALYVAGATAASANADDLCIGDSSGDRGLTVRSGAGLTGSCLFTDTGNGTQGGFVYDHTTEQLTVRINNFARMTIGAGDVSCGFDNATDLGTASLRWQDAYFAGTVRVQGASTESAPAAMNSIIAGNTGQANCGITLYTTTTGRSALNFSDLEGAFRSGFAYDHNTDELEFVHTAATRMNMSGSALYPENSGVMTLGSNTKGWDQVWFDERGAPPTSAAGFGCLYVDDSAPNALWYVDDTDVPRNLSRMPNILCDPAAGQTYATRSYFATSLVSYVDLIDSATREIWWHVQIPHTYNGQQLTLRIHWAQGAAGTGNVRFQYSTRRWVAGEDANTLNSSTTTVTVAASGTNLRQQTDNLSTNVSIDSAVAGEWIRLKLGRLGSDGSDTFVGSAYLIAVELLETVA